MTLNMTEVAGAQMQGAPASGIVEIAEHLRRSSVLIGDGPGGRGGSGVIWETGANKSVIITNAHVVKGRRARVTLRDGQTSEGRVTRLDARSDLAALTIETGGLPVATIGDSDALRVGELVFAVGNPLGLVGALAVGIVHANGRQWIGADVRLAPGNSGGMLADADRVGSAGDVSGASPSQGRGVDGALEAGCAGDDCQRSISAEADFGEFDQQCGQIYEPGIGAG